MTRGSKTFCFFCSYEIYNEKFRTVIYKNNIKKVCFFCTPGMHKACRQKYKDCQVDCQICEKPVKFNKCVKCFICNHLIHTKCNGLTAKDIALLEVHDSFICLSCNKSTFPFGNEPLDGSVTNLVPSKHKKIKCDKIMSQCFTCPNIIDPRKRYKKKYIIYNEKIATLCVKCSNDGINLPIRE